MNAVLRRHVCIPNDEEAHRPMCRVCPLPCDNTTVHIDPADIPGDNRYEPEAVDG